MSQNGQSVSNNFGTLGIKGFISFFSHVISFLADTNKLMQSAKAAHKIIREPLVMEYFIVNLQIYNLKRGLIDMLRYLKNERQKRKTTTKTKLHSVL